MNKLMTIPVFASKSQFMAAYSYVNDPVCLFSPESGELVAGNPVFWQIWGNGLQEEPAFCSVIPALTEEDNGDAILHQYGDKGPGLLMHISRAMLDGQALSLAIGRKPWNVHLGGGNLQEAEAEKKALLNEVYHRVKNNLNIIVSLLSLQINRISNPEMRLLLLESKSRIFTLSLLQQNLYSSSRIAEIKTGTYLQTLANSILSTFKPKEKCIRLISKIEEGWLDIDTLTPLGLIFHELLANAVLHAFAGKESGEVHICFAQLQDNYFQLQVKDNGIGLPQGKAASEYSTLGFQLISSLCRQLHASLEIDSDPHRGTSASVAFKRTGI